MLRRRFPFNLIEKRKLSARHVFHLLPKRPHSFEISLRRNVGVLLLGHRFRHAEKSLLRPAQRQSNAPPYTLRKFLRLRQRARHNENHPRQNKKGKQSHANLPFRILEFGPVAASYASPASCSTNLPARELTGRCPLKYRCLSTGSGVSGAGPRDQLPPIFNPNPCLTKGAL